MKVIACPMAGLYQYWAHPVWSVFFLCHPHPSTGKDGLYKVRDNLTLTTWANHCSWPIRDSHLLLWLPGALVEGPGNMCPQASSVSECFSANLHPKRTVQGNFFLLPLGMLLWTLLNSGTGDFKTCTPNLYVICSIINHSFFCLSFPPLLSIT